MVEYKIPMSKVYCQSDENDATKYTLTRIRKPSAILQADLATPGLCQAIFHRYHATIEDGATPFQDTPFGVDPSSCHRPGVCKDKTNTCSGKSSTQGGYDVERVYTNLLYCQGSTLCLSLRRSLTTWFPITHPEAGDNKRNFQTIKQKEMYVNPVGEPVIMHSGVKNEDFGRPGDSHCASAIRN